MIKGCGKFASFRGSTQQPAASPRPPPYVVRQDGRDHMREGEASTLDAIAEFRFSHAARALEHCGCGQAQRSFRPLPSAASEQAWLQYFSPADTGQVHCGLPQRSSIAASTMNASWVNESNSLRCMATVCGGFGFSIYGFGSSNLAHFNLLQLSAVGIFRALRSAALLGSITMMVRGSQVRVPNATVSRPILRRPSAYLRHVTDA